MKNIILIIIVVVLGCSSCSDILDKGPKDKYSENEIWSSIELSQAFLYTALNNSKDKFIMADEWTDNCVIQEDGGSTNVNKEAIDRSYDAGWDVYGDVRMCNLAIQKIEGASFLESSKKNLIAQAKMMRAMIYFTRARLFGRLMIVNRVLDTNETMELPRTKTVKETYDFILNDLKEAAPDLPVTLQNMQGMLTQGAAYALIAEVALHGAAYIETGQQEYYQLAKEYSEKLFALDIYELDANYKSMFNDFDYAMNSKEIILAQWRHENNTTFVDTWMQGLGLNTNNDKNIPESSPKLVDDLLAWPTKFPSPDLVNTYQVIDEDGSAKNWDKSSYYKNFLQNGGYVSKAIYKNRDKRFYASIVCDSSSYFNNIATTRDKGNIHWNSNIYGDWGMTKTGYVWRKCVYEKKRIYYSDPTFYHYVLLRLGRSYLNYAEVMLRLGKADVALEYINKTRTRHGGLPALSIGLTLDEAWAEYKRERRVDLTMEGDRYWSLLRWGKADGLAVIPELNRTHQAISISADGKTFSHIALPYKVSDNIRVFTSKRYFMPVPQDQINQNPSLDQNPEW